MSRHDDDPEARILFEPEARVLIEELVYDLRAKLIDLATLLAGGRARTRAGGRSVCVADVAEAIDRTIGREAFDRVHQKQREGGKRGRK